MKWYIKSSCSICAHTSTNILTRNREISRLSFHNGILLHHLVKIQVRRPSRSFSSLIKALSPKILFGGKSTCNLALLLRRVLHVVSHMTNTTTNSTILIVSLIGLIRNKRNILKTFSKYKNHKKIIGTITSSHNAQLKIEHRMRGHQCNHLIPFAHVFAQTCA